MKTHSASSTRIEILEARIAPATLFAVDNTNQLLSFDSTTPGTIDATVPITGLQGGESIQGIDFRPATGELFGLGIVNTAGTDTGRIYNINLSTGAATQVGAAPFSTTLTDGASFGFDFNPTVDRIRIVNSGDQNLRVNPNNGALAGTDTALTAGANVVAAAYDRNTFDGGLTTLFGIDADGDFLVRIGGVDSTPSPNGGAVTNVGALGFDTGADSHFDITGDGAAFAILTPGGAAGLYSINLTTGAATLVAGLNPALILRGFAAQLNVAPITSKFAGGKLTITGNGAANTITVTEQATPGDYVVTGVNLGQQTNFSGVKEISVNTDAGNDTFTFNGDATAGTELPKNFALLSAGQLTASLNANVNIAGIASIIHSGTALLNFNMNTATAGGLTVTDGPGNSALNIQSGSRFLKNIAFNGGADGSDTLNVNGSLVGGSITNTNPNGTGGTDQFIVSGSTVSGGLNFSTSGTNPTFSIQSGSIVKGPVAAKFTNSNTATITQVVSSTLFGSFGINGTTANDRVNIGTSTIAGNVTFNGGAGGNDSLTINSALIGGGTLFTGGTGNAVLNISNSSVLQGSLTLTAPKSASGDFDLINSSVAGKILVTSGPGQDLFDVTNLQAGAGFAAILGNGANFTNFASVVVNGSLTLNGGIGADNFQNTSLSVSGPVAVNFGDGADFISLEGSVGGVKINGGNGGDVFFLPELFVRSGTSILGGGDDDILDIANGLFGGAFTFDAGPGNNSLNIEQAAASNDSISTIFGGAFSYKGGAGNDTVTLGLDANDRALFPCPAKFTGGPGVNTLTDDFIFSIFPYSASGFTIN